MNITEYVVVSVMAVVWVIMQMLKKPLFEKYNIKDWIPLVCGLLGILFNSWMNGWQFTFPVFLNGLASGFAATGLNESINTMFFKEKNYGIE